MRIGQKRNIILHTKNIFATFSAVLLLITLLSVGLWQLLLRQAATSTSTSTTKRTNTTTTTTTTTNTIGSLQTTTAHKVIAGVRITGGRAESQTKAELFNPQSNKSCTLTPFSPGRRHHTSCADLLCGGHGSEKTTLRSCVHINNASISLNLREKRLYHMCWKLPGEQTDVLLIGGIFSFKTTERISGFSSSTNFTLPYKTM